MLPQPLHTFKTADNFFVGATLDGDTLTIAQTRNEEHASEGRFPQRLTVLPREEAVKIARAILAADEDAAFDAHLEQMWQRHQDRFAMMDDAMASDVAF